MTKKTEPKEPQKPRVLVAEDEALIRLDLVELLTDEGYEVVGQASDGEAAVKLARELKPDLVVMDVKMPKMDGIAAAETIAEERIAPIVMLTAFSQRDLVERARDAGRWPMSSSPLMPPTWYRPLRSPWDVSRRSARSRLRSQTWRTSWLPARPWTRPRRCCRKAWG